MCPYPIFLVSDPWGVGSLEQIPCGYKGMPVYSVIVSELAVTDIFFFIFVPLAIVVAVDV